MMRKLAIAIVVLSYPTLLAAQPCEPSPLLPGLGPTWVSVTLHAGTQLKGTLICVDEDVLVLADGARIRTLPLTDVARIVKPRDSVLNGLLIGAAIGLWLGSVSYGEAKYGGADQGPYLASAVATFGAIGAAVDWLHGAPLTIYSRRPPGGPAVVGWRVRF